MPGMHRKAHVNATGRRTTANISAFLDLPVKNAEFIGESGLAGTKRTHWVYAYVETPKHSGLWRHVSIKGINVCAPKKQIN